MECVAPSLLFKTKESEAQNNKLTNLHKIHDQLYKNYILRDLIDIYMYSSFNLYRIDRGAVRQSLTTNVMFVGLISIQR